jgi:capsular polysaccharide transport system permease protein
MAEGHDSKLHSRQPFSSAWYAELLQSLTIMVRVIHAVIIRESRTRYGSSNIGYTWALINPAIELAILVLAFSLIGRTSPIAAPISVFLLTGIVPLFFWRGSVARGATAVSANLGLLSYPQVMPTDVIIARLLLEAVTSAVVFVMLIIGLNLVVGIPIMFFTGDPPAILAVALALVYFTFGCTFLSSSLARVLPIWPNIWGYMSRPIWLLSGVFFTLEQLPEGARAYMIYNPVAHMVEWTRSAMVPTFESSQYAPIFPMAFATVALLIGLVIDRILMMTGDEEIVS